MSDFGVYVMDHCQKCGEKLTPPNFEQYLIKENDKVIGIGVRCMNKECNVVPEYYELL